MFLLTPDRLCLDARATKDWVSDRQAGHGSDKNAPSGFWLLQSGALRFVRYWEGIESNAWKLETEFSSGERGIVGVARYSVRWVAISAARRCIIPCRPSTRYGLEGTRLWACG
jgi:hypothetical protein